MKERIINKMFELSGGKTTVINFSCQLFPEFSKEVSEIEFRKLLQELESEGLIEVLSGFKSYTNTLSDLSLMSLTKEGVAFGNILKSQSPLDNSKNDVLKALSVISGGKATYNINVRSELIPLFKNKINEDRLNNILIQLRYEKLVSGWPQNIKGVKYFTKIKISDYGLKFVEKFLNNFN